MSAIAIAGGVYHESVIWPEWDQVFGSGVRAAVALHGHVNKLSLHTYARSDVADLLTSTFGTAYEIDLNISDCAQTVFGVGDSGLLHYGLAARRGSFRFAPTPRSSRLLYDPTAFSLRFDGSTT